MPNVIRIPSPSLCVLFAFFFITSDTALGYNRDLDPNNRTLIPKPRIWFRTRYFDPKSGNNRKFKNKKGTKVLLRTSGSMRIEKLQLHVNCYAKTTGALQKRFLSTKVSFAFASLLYRVKRCEVFSALQSPT